MLATLQGILQQNLHQHFSLEQRRNNLYQIFLPIFYPDGDMMDMFIRVNEDGSITLCDCGLTLMRLSYAIDLESSEHKKNLLADILRTSGAYDDDGEICLNTTKEMLFNNIMQFSQIITNVINMDMLKKDNIESLFYENINQYICKTFANDYKLEHNFTPFASSPEIVVDYVISGHSKKPIYIFAAKGSNKVLKSVIAILRLHDLGQDFTSVVIHNDYSKLSKNDQKNVMGVADKLFYDLPSFMDAGPRYVQQTIH